MKLFLGILCTLVVVSISAAVYSEIQRRDDAKRIDKLEKMVTQQDETIDAINGEVGSSIDQFGGGGNGPFGDNDSLSSRVDSLCDVVSSAGC